MSVNEDVSELFREECPHARESLEKFLSGNDRSGRPREGLRAFFSQGPWPRKNACRECVAALLEKYEKGER